MARAVLLLLFALGIGCNETPTQVLVVAHLDPTRGIDQIQIGAQIGPRLFPRVRRPELAASMPLPDPQSIAILLPDETAGQELALTVEGLRQGATVAGAAVKVTPIQSASVPAEVWLGTRPSDAGIDLRRSDARADLPPPRDAKELGPSCPDADKDGITTCAGDCDDADGNAKPGQTGFFSTPTKGTGNYDYDCNKIEEKEVKQLVGCFRVGGDCQGHGWQNGVPACGGQGTFITCRPSGPTSCAHDQSQKTQGCR